MGRRRGTNKDLPQRMYEKSGSYYFVDIENKWHNLGRVKHKAIAEYANFIGPNRRITTMSDVIDRYMTEVSPKKAETTYKGELRLAKTLKAGLGKIKPEQITKRTVYAYLDARRNTPTQANREFALLSHMLKKAVRWAVIDENPCIGVEKFKEKPRKRYVEDDEFQAFKKFAGEVIATYLDFKYLTGLRKKDILELRRDQLLEDGIHLTVSKNGKPIIMKWSDDLRVVVERAKRLHCSNPNTVRFSQFLFCTRKGTAYTPDGFSSNWQRQMNKALENGVIRERFTEHDIRAKAGSDSESLQAASALLTHGDSKTTERSYRRKATVIRPLK